MIRGTTPTITFTIPFDVSLLYKVFVTMKQTIEHEETTEIIQVDKSIDQCSLTGNKIMCRFTQEDTLKFKENMNVKIQLRVLTLDSESLTSKVFEDPVSELLKDGVI
jgi:hypothetical protein